MVDGLDLLEEVSPEVRASLHMREGQRVQVDSHPILQDFERCLKRIQDIGFETTDLPADVDELVRGFYNADNGKEGKRIRKRKLQGVLSRQMENALLDEWYQGKDKKQAARIKSLQSSGAASLLTTVPSEFSLRLAPHRFRTAVQMRHGVFELPDDKCKCSQALTVDHALGCPAIKAVKFRHDRLRDTLDECLREAGILRSTEWQLPIGQARIDILAVVANVKQWIDVSVVNPCAPTYLNKHNTHKKKLAAANTRESSKMGLWEGRAHKLNEDCKVVPAVIETYGAFGDKLRKFLIKVERYAIEIGKISRKDGWYEKTVSRMVLHCKKEMLCAWRKHLLNSCKDDRVVDFLSVNMHTEAWRNMRQPRLSFYVNYD